MLELDQYVATVDKIRKHLTIRIQNKVKHLEYLTIIRIQRSQ